MSELKLHTRLMMAAKGNINRPMLAELLMESSQALRANAWISVDNLPDEDLEYCVDVLSESQGRMIDCSYCRERSEWCTVDDDLIDDVTHYMLEPLYPCEN